MTLKAVPKDEGFELREKRAEKNSDGRKWLPCDALYDAYTQLKDEPPSTALVIAWYHTDKDGTVRLKYRCWQEGTRQSVALAADLLAGLTS